MKNKTLWCLSAVAVVLGVLAYFSSSGSKASSPRLNGKAVFPGLDVSAVASVDVGGKQLLVSGEKGWTVASLYGYPADRGKIAENFLKLVELKVGQVVRGRPLDGKKDVVLKDSSGKVVASVSCGEKHSKWGRGRYAAFEGQTVLLSDALDAFDGDAKAWVDTKIVDTPYINFSSVVDPAADSSLFGFSTGTVVKVTVAGDTNRVATIGGTVAGGTDRYFKLDGSAWVYTVAQYSVESLLPKPKTTAESEEKK